MHRLGQLPLRHGDEVVTRAQRRHLGGHLHRAPVVHLLLAVCPCTASSPDPRCRAVRSNRCARGEPAEDAAHALLDPVLHHVADHDDEEEVEARLGEAALGPEGHQRWRTPWPRPRRARTAPPPSSGASASRRAERKRMFMQNFFRKPIRCMYSSLSPVGLSTRAQLVLLAVATPRGPPRPSAPCAARCRRPSAAARPCPPRPCGRTAPPVRLMYSSTSRSEARVFSSSAHRGEPRAPTRESAPAPPGPVARRRASSLSSRGRTASLSRGGCTRLALLVHAGGEPAQTPREDAREHLRLVDELASPRTMPVRSAASSCTSGELSRASSSSRLITGVLKRT